MTTQENIQVWTFSDIVSGPFESPGGPVAPLLQSRSESEIQVRLATGRASAFRLTEFLDGHYTGVPDLIVTFGCWRNVLSESICVKSGSTNERYMPTRSERQGFEYRQKTIFDDPVDFLTAYLNATIAQTTASVLLVGPRHYLWRLTPNSLRRPLQRFMIKDMYDDAYQGYKQFGGIFMALYLPSSSQRQVVIEPDGTVSMPYLLSRFRKVLVMSAGRGKFWSDVIKHMVKDVADGKQRLAFCDDAPDWANDHKNEYYASYMESIARGVCAHCHPPETCMRCLRRVRNWCEIPNRKWLPRSANACIGPDDAINIGNERTWACTMM